MKIYIEKRNPLFLIKIIGLKNIKYHPTHRTFVSEIRMKLGTITYEKILFVYLNKREKTFIY
jgi:hypothetical protein